MQSYIHFVSGLHLIPLISQMNGVPSPVETQGRESVCDVGSRVLCPFRRMRGKRGAQTLSR